ncbi:MAG: flavin reductase [Bacteroidales bacterium]|nr:flavin reductase [Bacteroidales bacterium]
MPINNLTHGLYVLTTRLGEKDNGCIIDAVMQVTAMPQRIAIGVQKHNLTNGMIMASRIFNLSILTEEVPQDVIKHFGYQSGRDVNKFENCEEVHRSTNGLIYIPKYTNAFLSAKVIQTVDMDTHTVFFAEITEGKILSDIPGMTYNNYRASIKPKA